MGTEQCIRCNFVAPSLLNAIHRTLVVAPRAAITVGRCHRLCSNWAGNTGNGAEGRRPGKKEATVPDGLGGGQNGHTQCGPRVPGADGEVARAVWQDEPSRYLFMKLHFSSDRDEYCGS